MPSGSFTFDTGVPGAFVTVSDSSALNSVTANEFTYTAATLVGGLGAAYDNAAFSLMRVHLGGAVGIGYLSFRITRTSTDTGNTIIAAASQGGTTVGQIRWTNAGNIVMRDGGTTILTSTETYALNTDIRVEWKMNKAAGTQEIRVYPAWDTTPTTTLTGAATNVAGTTMNQFDVGSMTAAGGAGTFIIDDLGYDTSNWVGAISSPPSVGPAFTVWNGTTEKPAVVTVWNGSTEKPLNSKLIQT